MSKAAIKTAAAAVAATMKTITTKTPGKTEVNYRLTTRSVRLVSKSYGLGTDNMFAVSFDTEGSKNFVPVRFSKDGALPEKDRYLAMLLEDEHTISWSRPIDLLLEHLCSIMLSKYSESISKSACLMR